MENSAILSLCFLLVLGVISGYHMYRSHTLGKNGISDNRRLREHEVSENRRLSNQVSNVGESLTLCLQILEKKGSMNCTDVHIDGIFEVRVSRSISNYTDFGNLVRVKLSEFPSVRVLEKCVVKLMNSSGGKS